MAKQGSIKNYRQTGANPAPPSLPYGEIAISKDGIIYAGNENNVPVGMYGANLLDNTNFANPVNQRGVRSTITAAGYFIDRWKLVSGSVTLTANGLQLNGTMVQILEFAAGTDTAARVGMYSGTATATYNNNDKTFTLASTGGVIEWAKLEKGTAATPYVDKGFTAETLKCQRYYLDIRGFSFAGYSAWQTGTTITGFITIPTAMRITPTLNAEGLYISGHGISNQINNPTTVNLNGNSYNGIGFELGTVSAGANLGSLNVYMCFFGGVSRLSADL